MQGGHDLGGMQGLGPINPEKETEEQVFHSEWERRAFAITIATGMLGQWNIDQSRYARERQHPIDYLKNSYYENWYQGVCKLLVENDLITAEELQSGKRTEVLGKELRVPTQADAKKILSSGGPTLMDLTQDSKFALGQKVRVKRNHTEGHTRAPAYVQGCIGEIAIHHGGHVYPDAHANGDRRGEHLYTVRFTAKELWGSDSANNEVFIDLWEPYLAAV